MYESSDGFYEFIVHATYWSFLITCMIMVVHVYTFCICVYRSYGVPFISKILCENFDTVSTNPTLNGHGGIKSILFKSN